MAYTTVLLQKIFTYEGTGLDAQPSLIEDLAYTVAQGCTSGVQYVRAGNASEGMALVTLMKNGEAMRLFPISAGGTVHVPLAIVDDLKPGTDITVLVSGESSGTVVLDIGILEVSTM